MSLTAERTTTPPTYTLSFYFIFLFFYVITNVSLVVAFTFLADADEAEVLSAPGTLKGIHTPGRTAHHH